jgi:hypothetical protein
MKTYKQHLNESKKQTGPLSEAVKKHISEMCEGMLHEAAKSYHNDPHADHTYEGYMKECGSYMTEKLHECMESWKMK